NRYILNFGLVSVGDLIHAVVEPLLDALLGVLDAVDTGENRVDGALEIDVLDIQNAAPYRDQRRRVGGESARALIDGVERLKQRLLVSRVGQVEDGGLERVQPIAGRLYSPNEGRDFGPLGVDQHSIGDVLKRRVNVGAGIRLRGDQV